MCDSSAGVEGGRCVGSDVSSPRTLASSAGVEGDDQLSRAPPSRSRAAPRASGEPGAAPLTGAVREKSAEAERERPPERLGRKALWRRALGGTARLGVGAFVSMRAAADRRLEPKKDARAGGSTVGRRPPPGDMTPLGRGARDRRRS